MADAGARGHDAEIVKGRRAPAQKAVTLDIALIFPIDIFAEGLGGAEEVDHHRVVNHQVHGAERVDLFRVGAQMRHGVAHGGQVHHRRHAGEVLHQNPGRPEADFVLHRTLVFGPGRKGLEVVAANGFTVFVAQQVLKKHLHGSRKARNTGQTGFFRSGKAVIDVGLSSHLEFPAGLEAID